MNGEAKTSKPGAGAGPQKPPQGDEQGFTAVQGAEAGIDGAGALEESAARRQDADKSIIDKIIADGVFILHERVRFDDHGKPISWERSFDDRQTWKNVEWPGEQLPFVSIGTVEMPWESITETVMSRREAELKGFIRKE